MAQEWSGQTGGTHWMQRALVPIIRKTDIRIIYGVMNVVVTDTATTTG